MKLLLGFICVSLIAAIIGAVGIFGLNAVKAADKNMWDNGTSALL
jgi:Flp pilus assembly pilin Flp